MDFVGGIFRLVESCLLIIQAVIKINFQVVSSILSILSWAAAALQKILAAVADGIEKFFDDYGEFCLNVIDSICWLGAGIGQALFQIVTGFQIAILFAFHLVQQLLCLPFVIYNYCRNSKNKH